MGKVVNFPSDSKQAKFKAALEWTMRIRDKAQRESEKLGQLPPWVVEVITNSHGRLDLFVVRIARRRLRCIECETLMSVGDYYFAAVGTRTSVPCAQSEAPRS